MTAEASEREIKNHETQINQGSRPSSAVFNPPDEIIPEQRK